MAFLAIRSESACVEGRIFVAGYALSRKSCELTARMAIFTAHLDVSTGQRKIALIMAKCNNLPILRGMTGSAVCTKAAVVLIVLLVAGIAISGRALEDVILMTIHAVYIGMFPLQLEGRQIVVKCCVFPTISCMAGFAGCPKA